jgi:hypothetical protein
MAFTSAKMSLRIWNLLTDLYDHAQLADNWAKVDYHDHSPGKGVQVPTDGIADAAVTPAKLAALVDPSGAYISAKPIIKMGTPIGGGAAASTLVLRTDEVNMTLPATALFSALYLDPADWTTPGRTVKYMLRGTVTTNAVAPTCSYNFALYPVASWGGASGSAPTIATFGTVVPSSTTPTIAAPAAAGPAAPVVSVFDAPAAGWYALAVIQTGASAANANVSATSSLYAKQV